jgi:hypothetical protein
VCVTNEEVIKKAFNQKEERKRKKISCVLYKPVINSGMFHSGEERNRTVDPLNELQHSYESTTANPTSTFELDQITPGDFDPIGFDFDGNFGRSDSWGTNSSTSVTVGEPQSFTTFTSEDKWPI